MDPHWLDDVIVTVLREQNPKRIAHAISHSEKFLNAIQTGLERASEGCEGIRPEQIIRKALIEAIAQ